MVEVVKEIMQSGGFFQTFFTVIAGVFVFAISQWITITVINPHQTYLKSASNLSQEMLKLTHRYTNFVLDQDEVGTIRNANAAYLASVWNSGCFGLKRRRKKGFEVAQCINGIVGLSLSPTREGYNKGKSVVEAISKIEKIDKNLKIQYKD